MTVEPLDEDIRDTGPGPLLVRMRVEDLFGRYTYTIGTPKDQDGSPSRLMLIYGDNGSGKTTVLRLLWHILSPADNRGHRSAIAQTPFRSATIEFSDGSAIQVVKTEDLTGSFRLNLTRPAAKDIVVRFVANERGRINSDSDIDEVEAEHWVMAAGPNAKVIPESVKGALANRKARMAYIKFLEESRFNPNFLADDRTLHTDDTAVERARERFGARWQPGAHEPPRRVAERADQLVARELQITVNRVNELLRSLTIRGQNVGSAGANSIYTNVLKQLGTARPEGPAQLSDEAYRRLDALSKQSPRFEEFGLIPHFAADEFGDLLSAVPPERQQIAHEILIPYLNSLSTRIEALAPAEGLLRSLLSLINDFLTDKRFIFNPRQGLRIVTSDGADLAPRDLSSGERQLTMLLFTTLLAPHESRLFIIDEPELSLGVDWQRRILNSLLALTEGSSLQFVVATHSIEMITSQRTNAVKLENENRARDSVDW